jgi:hypothetical protein
MTQDQQNVRTMFDTVLNYLNGKNSIWSGKVAFSDAVTRATAAVGTIDSAADAQQTPTSGVTQDKEAVRNDLEEETLRIADQLSAYAAKNGKLDLGAQVEMTKSSLDKLLDNDLEQTAERVSTLASANIAALADYDITAANVTALDTLRTNFAGKKTAPRQAQTGRATATTSLEEAIRNARSLFRNELDKLMTNFKKTNLDFYNGYFAARVIVNKAATLKLQPGTPTAGVTKGAGGNTGTGQTQPAPA